MTIMAGGAVRATRVGIRSKAPILRRLTHAGMTHRAIHRRRTRILMALIRTRVTTGIRRFRLGITAGMATTGVGVGGRWRVLRAIREES